MLKFKTSCAVLAYLSSNLLNEVGLSLFRYFGLRVCDIVVKKLTFAISSPDEFLSRYASVQVYRHRHAYRNTTHPYRGRNNKLVLCPTSLLYRGRDSIITNTYQRYFEMLGREVLLPRDAMLARFMLSSCVRLSVWLSQAGTIPKRLNA